MIRNSEKLTRILSSLKPVKEHDASVLFGYSGKSRTKGTITRKFEWDLDFVKECKGQYTTEEPTMIHAPSSNQTQHKEVCNTGKAGISVSNASELEDFPDNKADRITVEAIRTKLLSKAWKESEEEQKAVLALTDNQFDQLLEPPFGETLPLNICEKLCYVLGKGYCESRKRKLVCLGSKVLMPKISSGTPIRDIIQAVKYMAAADSFVATEFVFFPMLQRQLTIPRPLLAIVDKGLLLRLFLSWMSCEAIEFSEHTIQLCTTLFENRKTMDEQVLAHIFLVFRNSFQSKPEDKSLAHFFRTCIDNYGWQLKQSTLKELLAINDFNRSSNKEDVQNILEAKLNLLGPLRPHPNRPKRNRDV